MKPQKHIRTVKKEHEQYLLHKANTNSVGIGYKQVNGKKTDELSIVVGVRKKLPKAKLLFNDVLPLAFDDVTVDVVETGQIKALEMEPRSIASIDPKQKHRPICPGISVAHKNVSAGTIACIVNRDGYPTILSNNHVLSNSNDAEIGDEVLQPGPWDGGTSEDRVGRLLDFIPIDFGSGTIPPIPPIPPPTCPYLGSFVKLVNALASIFHRDHRLAVVNTQAAYNAVDAAVSTIEVEYRTDIPQIGQPTGVRDATLGEATQKFGRTTSYTAGTVDQLYATVNVAYDDAGTKMATFTDQIILGPMSQGGDSISWDTRLYWKENNELKFGNISELYDSFTINKNIIFEVPCLQHKNNHVNSRKYPSMHRAVIGWGKVRAALDHGVKNVFQVILRDGKNIKVTEDHSLFSCSGSYGNELKPATINDSDQFVSVDFPIEQKNNDSEDILATFSGLWLADGSWVKDKDYLKGICISTGNEKNIVSFLENNFSGFKHKSKGDYRKYSVDLVDKMLKLGHKPDDTSYTKRVPKCVFTWSDQMVASFLKGYFSGDGWSYYKEAKPVISCGSVHLNLLLDIQFLLSRLGIKSAVDNGCRNKLSKRKQYKLNVHNLKSITHFMEAIGFIKESPLKLQDLIFDNHDIEDQLPVKLRKVREIIPIGEEKVFDLKVDNYESFVANGILCHNSGSSVLGMDGNLIGLLFAGSDQITIASPMKTVFSLLNLTL